MLVRFKIPVSNLITKFLSEIETMLSSVFSVLPYSDVLYSDVLLYLNYVTKWTQNKIVLVWYFFCPKFAKHFVRTFYEQSIYIQQKTKIKREKFWVCCVRVPKQLHQMLKKVLCCKPSCNSLGLISLHKYWALNFCVTKTERSFLHHS